jgi:hypothetical protein
MKTLQQDVERGLEIRKEIEALQAELKAIEKRLEIAGLNGQQVPLQDADREGRQWIAKGVENQVAVIFTADSLVSSFAHESATHLQLRDLLGTQIREFFRQTWTNKFRDGKDFRAHALEILGKEKAPSLVTICLARDKDGTPKSKVVVAWNDAKTKGET